MKNLKKMIAVVLVVIMMLAVLSCYKTANATIVWAESKNKVEAEVMRKLSESYFEKVQKNGYKDGIEGFGEFELNANELLAVYVLKGSDKEATGYQVTKEGKEYANKIPVYYYDQNKVKKLDGSWSDGKVDSRDASAIYTLTTGHFDVENYSIESVDTLELKAENWFEYANQIKLSLAEKLNISEDKVGIKVKVTYPAVKENDYKGFSYELTGEESFENSEVREKIIKLLKLNYEIDGTVTSVAQALHQEYIVVTATANGVEYYMYFDKDNNFYLINPNESNKEFSTVLNYKSISEEKIVEGKMSSDGSTYLPPYYENENKNAKKDADAIAIISSKTNEDIIATNGVKMNEDGKPNSQGWYYPDTKNLKVIEKKYPFDTYNNPKDNGAVKETVKLTGRYGGEDEQTPSIEWTLRRINYDEKKNDDGSITVTITYNLPIDEKSIPDGWEPIKDSDGGIRKITKTIKSGESYDKDVTVEQNGPSTKTVTTPVKVITEKLPAQIPQTGVFGAIIVAVIAGATVFMVTRFRKIRK